ncbi:palmitoleoyl-protein carboxylesterase NOTUM isoform X1 [Haliaeetus albicilla]
MAAPAGAGRAPTERPAAPCRCGAAQTPRSLRLAPRGRRAGQGGGWPAAAPRGARAGGAPGALPAHSVPLCHARRLGAGGGLLRRQPRRRARAAGAVLAARRRPPSPRAARRGAAERGRRCPPPGAGCCCCRRGERRVAAGGDGHGGRAPPAAAGAAARRARRRGQEGLAAAGPGGPRARRGGGGGRGGRGRELPAGLHRRGGQHGQLHGAGQEPGAVAVPLLGPGAAARPAPAPPAQRLGHLQRRQPGRLLPQGVQGQSAVAALPGRENCDTRYDTMRRLMSSREWPATRVGTGILSSQPEENPHWWNANMVFIPYCSSDVWSGASSKSEKNEYAFMGALIIQEVIKELVGKGLSTAKVLLLAGSSAGGTGVLLNVDRVAEQLEEMGYQGIQVRGLADSGWFLDNKQYRRTDCIDTITCAPTEAIRRGIRYWNGIVPERCKLQFKEGEEWNCFFGYKIYPTLRCPVFVVQWLFDEAQLTVDNVHLTGQPVQEGQWLYIQNLGRELRNTLKDVTASFAPACLSHEIITRNHWTDIQVKGTSLPRALHCWDRSLHESNKNGKAPLKGCPIHLIDSCPWPHCNPSCPTIRDQFTGQEMNVIQFLMHMGFDVQKMAQQQGLEPSKLLGMLSSGN